MTREQILENTVAELVAHTRALHAIVSSLLVDNAAIRRTLLRRPKDRATYARTLKSGAAIAKPLTGTAMRAYDEIIQKIRACDGLQEAGPEDLHAKLTMLQ